MDGGAHSLIRLCGLPIPTITEGIRSSLAWFDAHPERKVPDAAMNSEMDAILERWRIAMECGMN